MTKEVSKAQALAEAARKRHQVEKEAQEAMATAGSYDHEQTVENTEAEKEAAEMKASIRPQAVDKSLTGELDIEAMGDVKGDGGDAKDYDDGDPAKALGVPVYKHGLNEHGGNIEAGMNAVFGERLNKRTQAEQERGRKAISDVKDGRETSSRKGRTVVTDAADDPDGDNGKSKAEKAAAEAKARVAAKEKAEAEAKEKAEAK